MLGSDTFAHCHWLECSSSLVAGRGCLYVCSWLGFVRGLTMSGLFYLDFSAVDEGITPGFGRDEARPIWTL